MNELFEPALAERVLARALSRGGDFAELYAERRASFSLSLDDRKVERAQTGHELGAGVRVIAGEVAVAVGRKQTAPRPLRAAEPRAVQTVRLRPEEVPAEQKAALLVECDERARSASDAVAQVSAGYNEVRRQVQVANSDGLVSGDDRT